MRKSSGRESSGLKKYFGACAVFFVFMMFCIAYFFYCVETDVVNTAERTIVEHVKRQAYHFQKIMDIHFGYLEGMASYIGSGELLGRENMELLQSMVYGDNNFERMAIIDKDGVSTYEDGTQKDVSNRKYFHEAMEGKRALSDPIDSKVDGNRRVIMAVPVFFEEEAVGVLGGSYDVGFLGHLLFEDLYDGEGYTMIVTASGTVISCDREEKLSDIRDQEHFFEAYETMKTGGDAAGTLRKDFAAGTGRCIKLKTEQGDQYLVYEPLADGRWMICYVVPAAKVCEDFGFIRYYEVILSAMLLGGLTVLAIYVWKARSREQRELIRYAQTDALTKALNKDSTEKRMNQWLRGGQRTGIQVFLMLDIDNFKTVNDGYGHQAGDEALRQIGNVLAQEFRENDVVGRIGGDEFAVLMKNMADQDIAVARIENLCQRIRELKVDGIPENLLSCSVGVALSPIHGNSYQELYLCADKALYETKKRGRDGYTLYLQDREPERGDTKKQLTDTKESSRLL